MVYVHLDTVNYMHERGLFLSVIRYICSGKEMRLQAGSRRTQDLHGEEALVWDGKNSEFSVFDFEQVLEATDNFSEENKLGQGGFGAVYKVN